MAGKKNIDEVEEEVVVTKPNKNGKVPYMIPLSPDPRDEKYVYASLNGKGYKIKKGVWVNIPLALKEILDNSIAENMRASEEAERLQNEFIAKSRALNII